MVPLLWLTWVVSVAADMSVWEFFWQAEITNAMRDASATVTMILGDLIRLTVLWLVDEVVRETAHDLELVHIRHEHVLHLSEDSEVRHHLILDSALNVQSQLGLGIVESRGSEGIIELHEVESHAASRIGNDAAALNRKVEIHVARQGEVADVDAAHAHFPVLHERHDVDVPDEFAQIDVKAERDRAARIFGIDEPDPRAHALEAHSVTFRRRRRSGRRAMKRKARCNDECEKQSVSIHRGNPFVDVCGAGRPGPALTNTFIRNELRLETRCSQLEHEAKATMEAQPVEVDLLAHILPDRRIVELGFRSARVPDRFAVEPRGWADVQVHSSEHLRAEAVVVILEIESGVVGAGHAEPFPACGAADVRLHLAWHGNANAQGTHDRHHTGVDGPDPPHPAVVGTVR